MTDGYPPSTPYPAGDRPPFDPFVLEPQKAHNSTGSPAPAHPGRRRLRIPGPLLGLLLALAVAVPTVVATLPPAGQDSSDGGSAAPADQASPSEGGGELAPLPDQTPSGPADPPSSGPGWQQSLAVEDCLENARGLWISCEDILREDAETAARYLACREAGLPADKCLVAPPR
jgi:hypothetical protein